MKMPTCLPSTWASLVQSSAYHWPIWLLSSTVERSISLPWRPNCAIWPGPGRPAVSGGLPPETRVVSTALRSRVPSYWTLAPVASSYGLTMARKFCCSSPPQVASTLTLPPTCCSCGLVAAAGVPAGLVAAAPGVPVAPAAGVPVAPAAGVPVPEAAGVPVPAAEGVPVPAARGVPVAAPAVPVPAGVPAPAAEGVPVPAAPDVPAGLVAAPDGVPAPVAGAVVALAAGVADVAPPHACSSGTATNPSPRPRTERRDTRPKSVDRSIGMWIVPPTAGPHRPACIWARHRVRPEARRAAILVPARLLSSPV